MRVNILFFAVLREIVGHSEEVLELPTEVSTIEQLRELLETRMPALRGRLGSVRFARNEVFSAPGEVIADGDRIALIPPVAGG